MSKIILASQNPVKLQATLNGFAAIFPDKSFDAQTVSVPSGVSDQPMSSEETLQGAVNRAQGAREWENDAEYWVGIEGGVEQRGAELEAFAWVVILSQTQKGKGRTGSFFLPPQVAELVRQGKELGEADDIVFGESNSKQKNGAVGLLTGNVIDRTQLYQQAVMLALIPFLNPTLFPIQTENE
ncbi:MAG: non-canonical purine NTP phosphatase [Chloroflexi bacterium]|nr:MAG: non-canonical purine NTP phosphatase [Chloroflexota bacterium]MBL1195796.1 non-canonical purine NTP phosphatase [Chloroflexota bacterium]NOH13087.1 inosine/xanthosine triphosphatase [Chloroflexota bacterium]